MPVLLFGIGVFAFVAGLVMIGFGIPINEFSFGNTLISAGTTASVGGLVIIAIGIAVGQLRRIAGMLADPASARLAMPLEDLEPIAVPRKAPAVAPALTPAPVAQSASAGGRAPFPPRQKADPFDFEPEPLGAPMGGPMGAPMAAPKTGAPMDERPDQSFAPSLPNPDEAPFDNDISLSPRHPQGAPAPAGMPPGALDRTSDSIDWRVPPPAPGAPGGSSAPRPQPANFDANPAARTQPANFDANPAARTQPANFDANPAARTQPANFDAMWPAEGKVDNKAAKVPSFGLSSGAPAGAAPARRAEPEKPRTVAILKSGVVDGMGYTLYVDGSIEAELPQGTLRFASINELRSHLEKNS